MRNTESGRQVQTRWNLGQDLVHEASRAQQNGNMERRRNVDKRHDAVESKIYCLLTNRSKWSKKARAFGIPSNRTASLSGRFSLVSSSHVT
eukprot:6203031-Pleurochrysis_carterae.AAC.1